MRRNTVASTTAPATSSTDASNTLQVPEPQQRRGSVKDRWKPVQAKPIVSPATLEANEMKGINVKGKINKFNETLQQVHDKYDVKQLKHLEEHTVSNAHSPMKPVLVESVESAQEECEATTTTTVTVEASPVKPAAQVVVASPQKQETMIAIPSQIAISSQLHKLQERIDSYDWTNAAMLLEQIEQGNATYTEQEHFFIDHSKAIYYNNYAVYLLSQQQLHSKPYSGDATPFHFVQKSKAHLAKHSKEEYVQRKHLYGYLLIHVNGSGIKGAVLLTEKKYADAASEFLIALPIFHELIALYAGHVADHFVKNFCINATVVAIRSENIELLRQSAQLLEQQLAKTKVQDNLTVLMKQVLGHAYKNLGSLEMKLDHYEIAQEWLAKALVL